MTEKEGTIVDIQRITDVGCFQSVELTLVSFLVRYLLFYVSVHHWILLLQMIKSYAMDKLNLKT